VLFLYGKFRVLSDKHSGSFALTLTISAPMWLAAFVAISRTLDYSHGFIDVVAGSIIGLVVAPCIYFLYYPSLWSENCHLPKLHASLM
jgi:diacylglycerol diphosphate phosphatase/phosphatidate phosphatase